MSAEFQSPFARKEGIETRACLVTSDHKAVHFLSFGRGGPAEGQVQLSAWPREPPLAPVLVLASDQGWVFSTDGRKVWRVGAEGSKPRAELVICADEVRGLARPVATSPAGDRLVVAFRRDKGAARIELQDLVHRTVALHPAEIGPFAAAFYVGHEFVVVDLSPRRMRIMHFPDRVEECSLSGNFGRAILSPDRTRLLLSSARRGDGRISLFDLGKRVERFLVPTGFNASWASDTVILFNAIGSALGSSVLTLFDSSSGRTTKLLEIRPRSPNTWCEGSVPVTSAERFVAWLWVEQDEIVESRGLSVLDIEAGEVAVWRRDFWCAVWRDNPRPE